MTRQWFVSPRSVAQRIDWLEATSNDIKRHQMTSNGTERDSVNTIIAVRSQQLEVDGPTYFSASCDAPRCTGLEDAGLKDPDAAGPWFSRTWVKSVALADTAARKHAADHHAGDQVTMATAESWPYQPGTAQDEPIDEAPQIAQDDSAHTIYPPMGPQAAGDEAGGRE